MGCSGGLMDLGFEYVKEYGLECEFDYTYHGLDGTCQYNQSYVIARISSYVDVTPNSSSQLKAAISLGPVAVGVEADSTAFLMYAGGVISGAGCGTSIDHGVLAVGYGKTSSGLEYVTIKNSWGTSWGEQGFVRLAVADGAGTCGVNTTPSYPVV